MDRYSLKMTPSKMAIVAAYYGRHVMDIGSVLERIRALYDDVKAMEFDFYKRNDVNIVLEEDAIDFVIDQLVRSDTSLDHIAKRLSADFELGLKLAAEKTGKNRFFINRRALENPEEYIRNLFRHATIAADAGGTERVEPE